MAFGGVLKSSQVAETWVMFLVVRLISTDPAQTQEQVPQVHSSDFGWRRASI